MKPGFLCTTPSSSADVLRGPTANLDSGSGRLGRIERSVGGDVSGMRPALKFSGGTGKTGQVAVVSGGS